MPSLFDDELPPSTVPIPRRFIRVWLGKNPLPELFEDWWKQFHALHPDYEFMTLGDESAADLIPESLKALYDDCDSLASQSNVLRYAALKRYGGIYVDVDIMPLRAFDELLEETTPFAGRRSGVSFENAVIGCPPGHVAMDDLFDLLPAWYLKTEGSSSAAVRTGPAFLSHAWFGRLDVRHLPPKAFYPYNGFGAPKRDEKLALFSKTSNFPPGMYCAHFSNHRWGGRPTKP